MRNQLIRTLIVFCLLPLACERPKQLQDNFGFKPPKVVEAKAYKVPTEKTAPPKVIPVSGVKKVLAGKPDIVELKSNVFPAKAERIIRARAPKLFMPGKDGFKSPQIVPAIDSPFGASLPEIVRLKDFYMKENNPESFSSIKTLHGLRSNIISSLFQDKAGNLWMGSLDGGGVSKYDGRSLSNYSTAQGLSSDFTLSILEDKSGAIWISTMNSGVNKFDGRQITRYGSAQGLTNNFVWSMIQDKRGNIWFATNNGLYRYNGHSFAHYTTEQGLPNDSVRSMLEDRKGNFWFGTVDGVCKFDGRTFQNFMALGLSNNGTEVVSMLEDKEGNFWFAPIRQVFINMMEYL